MTTTDNDKQPTCAVCGDTGDGCNRCRVTYQPADQDGGDEHYKPGTVINVLTGLAVASTGSDQTH